MAYDCTLTIRMKIKAPVLLAATGVSAWGYDKTFHRNERGEPAIPKSHVKGKLREAWGELGFSQAFIKEWLGWEGSGENLADDGRGKLLFSDFVHRGTPDAPTKHHRIRIHPETGTAAEGALIAAEGLFKSGAVTSWGGGITFPATDEAESERLRKRLLAGLRWITALGSEKSVGFGRLTAVECEDWKAEAVTPLRPAARLAETADRRWGLTLTAAEPLLLGSVRIKQNYLETETIISGAAVKGALAQGIRRRLDLADGTPIEPGPKMDEAGLSLLARHFEAIRFTHAFPSPEAGRRPVWFPLSLVDEGAADVALMEGPGLVGGRAPAFSIDWKDDSKVWEDFGWARPRTVASTRTAIHAKTRGSRAERLYTFEAACPADDADRRVHWTGDVVLPDGLDDGEAAELHRQLGWVIRRWFDRIGKRDGRLETAALNKGPSRSAVAETAPVRDGRCIVTLQSDALMPDPWELRGGDRKTIHDAYAAYWQEASGGALKLERHLAAQKLMGGYLGRRFRPLGATDYYPFFLTAAGAVFVLAAADPDKADERCKTWKRRGLPPPAWALEKRYGKTGSGRLDWRRCPFTPENGFGEIAINLPCHWDLQAG